MIDDQELRRSAGTRRSKAQTISTSSESSYPGRHAKNDGADLTGTAGFRHWHVLRTAVCGAIRFNVKK
jgi:hypothetical protein